MTLTARKMTIPAPADDLESRKVLIVDDNIDFANATEDVLHELGYATRVAYNFRDGIECADEFSADVALLDIRLGDEDGVQLISALRERHPNILCVMITGQADTDSAVNALRNGASEYLHKPVDITMLDVVLNRCFERLQLQADKDAAVRALDENEARFRAFFENTPVCMNLKSVDGRFLMVNRSYGAWLNHPVEELLGKSAKDVIEDSERLDVISSAERAVLETGEISRNEIEVLREDESIHHRVLLKFPVRSNDGPISAIGTVALDVTEQRELQAQLFQAQKMETVGQLTGGIAHDFNNLLGVVISNLDFLSEELDDNADLISLVEPATEAALSCANLTRQLLAFSRKQRLTPKVIDLNAQVSDMMDMLGRTLGVSIEIETRLDKEARTTEVDPTQLESVLLNLALNARDAMPDGGRLIIETSKLHVDEQYAAAHSEMRAGDYAMLTVTDTGTGISPEVLEMVFDPFFTTKEVGKGSGLGLSMVFGFTKQSGGHVEIESEVGVGTTVKLYLPNVSKAIEASSQAPLAEMKACGEKVLVVEDHPALLKLAVNQLHNLGYETIEAKNGVSALEVLESTANVDLLLSDIVMPGGMSGPDLAKKAKIGHPDIKVLFMSGYTADAIEDIGSNNTDALMLQKPFRKAELARLLRTVLDS